MRQAEVIDILRRHEPQLREHGITALSIFGSTARDDARDDSDVDLAVRLDAKRQIGAFKFIAIELEIAELLGVSVDLVGEPARRERFQEQIDKDRVRVF